MSISDEGKDFNNLCIKLSFNKICYNDPTGKFEFKDIRKIDAKRSETTFYLQPFCTDFSSIKVLDLSYNFIQKLASMNELVELNTLQLHKNLISDFEEIKKLSILSKIEIITFFYNPLEEAENYRILILHMLNQSKNNNIRKIDKSEVTDIEREVVLSYSRMKNKNAEPASTIYMTEERIKKYKQFGYPQLQIISKDIQGPLKD